MVDVMATVQKKTCNICGKTKSVANFYRNKNMKDGYLGHCKQCILRLKKDSYNNPETRKRVLATNRKSRTGWSDEKYREVLVEQNGVCAICKHPCKSGRELAGDHCHKTGKPRGLLCGNCNRGISQFDDDIELLESAIAYLKRFT